MAKFDKIAVLGKIGSTGMVPVFYHRDAEIAKHAMKEGYGLLNLPTGETLPMRSLPILFNMLPGNVLKWLLVQVP